MLFLTSVLSDFFLLQHWLRFKKDYASLPRVEYIRHIYEEGELQEESTCRRKLLERAFRENSRHPLKRKSNVPSLFYYATKYVIIYL